MCWLMGEKGVDTNYEKDSKPPLVETRLVFDQFNSFKPFGNQCPNQTAQTVDICWLRAFPFLMILLIDI